MVEQWSVDANSRPYAGGYTSLDYSAIGFTMRPADISTAINEWWGTNSPGAYGSWVVYRYSSNWLQDNALLSKWRQMGSYTFNFGYALGYFFGINCISMSVYWATYGGPWGPAAGPVWYQQ